MTEKNHSQSNSPQPHIRYNKETDEWTYNVTYPNPPKTETIYPELLLPDKEPPPLKRKELDIIARLVAYMYHEKREEYENLASHERKEHIYNDLRSIDRWLAERYQYIKTNEQPK